MISGFVALLAAWSLLQRQTRDEHEENGQEEGAEDAGVERGVCSAMDVMICCW